MDELKKITRSEKRLAVLKSMGIESLHDLVYHLPYRYETIEKVFPPKEGKVVVEGLVINPARVFHKGRFSVLNVPVLIQDEEYLVTIFNRHFLRPHLKPGTTITIAGKLNQKKITASQIYLKTLDELSSITPVYSLKEGLTQKDFQKYALKALQLLKSDIKTQVPYDYRQKYHFMPLSDALHSIHQPMNFDEIKEALRMLKYEEFLQFSLTMQYIKMTREQEGGIIKIFDSQPLKQMIAHLPFHLTDDQQQAVREILHDMARPSAMYRFLQGDVGSGKTVVAAIALYANVLAGYQGALMVPTEVLANQHYASLKKLFASTNLEIGLLTGSLSLKEKREVHAQIADGTYDIIVGTHALFQEKVTYANLGLVITDEQHRFGVEQRKALKNKGNNVDFLVMSATPIPRTLAMTLYGDMDVSTIHTMPFGRQKTITKYVKGRSMRPFLNHLKQYLAGNGQVYVICPLIEDHETSSYKSATQVYEAMSRYFGGHYTLGLLHGALKEEDKARIMTQFQSNQIQILVSTTVIEVGIDVANANMMVIYDAHTFGLSQIHQLRGRIGRGQQQGYCYLLSDSEQEEAVERLRFMENHHDGFEIAQYDLELRGPGEVLGQKQSGLPSFTVGHIIRDFQILEASKNDAQEIIEAYYKYDEHHDLIVSIKEKITANNEYID